MTTQISNPAHEVHSFLNLVTLTSRQLLIAKRDRNARVVPLHPYRLRALRDSLRAEEMAVVVGGEIRRARELLRGVSVSPNDFLEKRPFLMTGEGFARGGGKGEKEGGVLRERGKRGRSCSRRW